MATMKKSIRLDEALVSRLDGLRENGETFTDLVDRYVRLGLAQQDPYGAELTISDKPSAVLDKDSNDVADREIARNQASFMGAVKAAGADDSEKAPFDHAFSIKDEVDLSDYKSEGVSKNRIDLYLEQIKEIEDGN